MQVASISYSRGGERGDEAVSGSVLRTELMGFPDGKAVGRDDTTSGVQLPSRLSVEQLERERWSCQSL